MRRARRPPKPIEDNGLSRTRSAHSPWTLEQGFAVRGTTRVQRTDPSTLNRISCRHGCELDGANQIWRLGRAYPLCPGISDINLFCYCQRIIYFDAEISDRAFDLCMSEKKLNGPEIASPPVDQGSFCAS